LFIEDGAEENKDPYIVVFLLWLNKCFPVSLYSIVPILRTD